ncbi:MAG: hypothetical protein U1E39_00590 [Planctomycetota bacterium]
MRRRLRCGLYVAGCWGAAVVLLSLPARAFGLAGDARGAVLAAVRLVTASWIDVGPVPWSSRGDDDAIERVFALAELALAVLYVASASRLAGATFTLFWVVRLAILGLVVVVYGLNGV